MITPFRIVQPLLVRLLSEVTSKVKSILEPGLFGLFGVGSSELEEQLPIHDKNIRAPVPVPNVLMNFFLSIVVVLGER